MWCLCNVRRSHTVSYFLFGSFCMMHSCTAKSISNILRMILCFFQRINVQECMWQNVIFGTTISLSLTVFAAVNQGIAWNNIYQQCFSMKRKKKFSFFSWNGSDSIRIFFFSFFPGMAVRHGFWSELCKPKELGRLAWKRWIWFFWWNALNTREEVFGHWYYVPAKAVHSLG